MVKFITQNLKYPAVSYDEGIQGKVIIGFVVNNDGKVSNVKILKSLDKYCDEEAKRVVQMFPKFTPGIKQGKPVKVHYSLPIEFRIN